MSALETRLGSPRFMRRLLWVSFLVLVAGAVAFLIAFFAGRSDSTSETFNNHQKIVDVTKTPSTVKLDPEARSVAREFLVAAVARKDLVKAYSLVGPDLKGGISLAEWKTGDIPVVPYPAAALEAAPFKIDHSYPREALLEVLLLPKRGAQVHTAVFYLQLEKLGKGARAHWVVNSWVPKQIGAIVPSARADG